MSKHISIDLDEDVADQAQPESSFVDEDAPLVANQPAGADVVDEDVDPLDLLPSHAVTNADGSVTLPLKHPRDLQIRKAGKIRTEHYKELRFHRLTGADLRAVSSTSDAMQTVVAFSRSTRISQAVMNALYDKMDGSDIAAGGQVLNSFFATGRKTGK